MAHTTQSKSDVSKDYFHNQINVSTQGKCNLKVGVSETQLVLHLSQSFINDMLTGSGQCKCKKKYELVPLC